MISDTTNRILENVQRVIVGKDEVIELASGGMREPPIADRSLPAAVRDVDIRVPVAEVRERLRREA